MGSCAVSGRFPTGRACHWLEDIYHVPLQAVNEITSFDNEIWITCCSIYLSIYKTIPPSTPPHPFHHHPSIHSPVLPSSPHPPSLSIPPASIHAFLGHKNELTSSAIALT